MKTKKMSAFGGKNKISIGVVSFLVLSFALSASALTDEEIKKKTSEPISSQEAGLSENQGSNISEAMVKVYNVRVANQKENKLTVEFDLENGKYLQQELKYSAVLDEIESKDGQEKTGASVLTHVFDDRISLEPEEKLHKKIEFEVPQYLSGEYKLWIEIHSEEAMALGMMVSSGKVKLDGSADNINIIRESCFLYVDGDKEKKYKNGIDISSSEKIYFSCEAENKSSQSIEAVPQIENFYRSVYGRSEGVEKMDPMAFSPKEKKVVTFEIPKKTAPQSYAAAFVFKNKDDSDISNKTLFYYVIQGLNATILSHNIDKSNYAKGETARLSVIIAPSADLFPNSRGTGSKAENLAAEALILDKEGNQCAKKAVQPISLNEQQLNMELSLPVLLDCPGAKAVIFIKDQNGSILDSINGDISVSDANLDKMLKFQIIKKIVFGAIAVILLFIFFSRLVSYLRMRKYAMLKLLVLFLIFCSSGLFGFYAYKAHAFSGSFSSVTGYVTIYFYYSSDKPVYVPGETMTIATWTSSSTPYNHPNDAKMYGTVNGEKKTFFDSSIYHDTSIYGYICDDYWFPCYWRIFEEANWNTTNGSKHFSQSFTVPSSQGTYQAYLEGWGSGTESYMYPGNIDGFVVSEKNINYRVINPPIASCATVSPNPVRESEPVNLNFTASDPNSSAWVDYTLTYTERLGEGGYWDGYGDCNKCSFESRNHCHWDMISGGYPGEDTCFEKDITLTSGQVSGSNYVHTLQWPRAYTGAKNYTIKVCQPDGACSTRNCSFDLTVIENGDPYFTSRCPSGINDPINPYQTMNLTYNSNDPEHDKIKYHISYCNDPYSPSGRSGCAYSSDYSILERRDVSEDWISDFGSNYKYDRVSPPYPREGIMHIKYTLEDDHGGYADSEVCKVQVGSRKIWLDKDLDEPVPACPRIYDPYGGGVDGVHSSKNYTVDGVADIRDNNFIGGTNPDGLQFYFDWNNNGSFADPTDQKVYPGGRDYYYIRFDHYFLAGSNPFNYKACDKYNNCSQVPCDPPIINNLPTLDYRCPTVTPSSIYVGEEATFTFRKISDNDSGDKVRYVVNWGDGDTFTSDFMNPWNSNIVKTHSWNTSGTNKTYTYYAEDNYGGTSPTKQCQVTVQEAVYNSCGADNLKSFCTASQLTQRCGSGSTVENFNLSGSKFTWDCKPASGSSVSCSAIKYCSTDDIWREINP